MGQVVIRDARVSDAAIKYYESLGWTLTGKTQIDKLDDLELHEIQYGTAI